jgi:hypothetical protein
MIRSSVERRGLLAPKIIGLALSRNQTSYLMGMRLPDSRVRKKHLREIRHGKAA